VNGTDWLPIIVAWGLIAIAPWDKNLTPLNVLRVVLICSVSVMVALMVQTS